MPSEPNEESMRLLDSEITRLRFPAAYKPHGEDSTLHITTTRSQIQDIYAT